MVDALIIVVYVALQNIDVSAVSRDPQKLLHPLDGCVCSFPYDARVGIVDVFLLKKRSHDPIERVMKYPVAERRCVDDPPLHFCSALKLIVGLRLPCPRVEFKNHLIDDRLNAFPDTHDLVFIPSPPRCLEIRFIHVFKIDHLFPKVIVPYRFLHPFLIRPA